jgi:hypothetical protein
LRLLSTIKMLHTCSLPEIDFSKSKTKRGREKERRERKEREEREGEEKEGRGKRRQQTTSPAWPSCSA